MNETFLVAWRRRLELNSPPTAGWLFGVADRLAANHHRRKRADLPGDEALYQEIAHTVSAEAAAIEDLDLAAAVRRIPAAEIAVLVAVAWDGLNPGELADLLGVSVNAATLRVHRARKRLDAELDGGMSSSRDRKPEPRVKEPGGSRHHLDTPSEQEHERG